MEEECLVVLHLGELGELHVELGQVGERDLLVEGLGEHVDVAALVLAVLVVPEGDLGQGLGGA